MQERVRPDRGFARFSNRCSTDQESVTCAVSTQAAVFWIPSITLHNHKNIINCDCKVLLLTLLHVFHINNEYPLYISRLMVIEDQSGNEAGIRLELGTHAAVSCIWQRMADDMAITGFVGRRPCFTMKRQCSTCKYQIEHNIARPPF